MQREWKNNEEQTGFEWEIVAINKNTIVQFKKWSSLLIKEHLYAASFLYKEKYYYFNLLQNPEENKTNPRLHLHYKRQKYEKFQKTKNAIQFNLKQTTKFLLIFVIVFLNILILKK